MPGALVVHWWRCALVPSRMYNNIFFMWNFPFLFHLWSSLQVDILCAGGLV